MIIRNVLMILARMCTGVSSWANAIESVRTFAAPRLAMNWQTMDNDRLLEKENAMYQDPAQIKAQPIAMHALLIRCTNGRTITIPASAPAPAEPINCPRVLASPFNTTVE